MATAVPADHVDRAASAAARRPLATVIARVVAALSLAGIAVGTWILVTAAASYPSVLVPARSGGLPSWIRGPFSGLGLDLENTTIGWWVIVVLGCYVALTLALIAVPQVLPLKPALAIVAGLHLLVTLAPPLWSTDVFGYLDFARMGALHGLNPYTHDSGFVAGDPIFQWVLFPARSFGNFNAYPSPYGPLFTLGSYVLVPLGIPHGLLALKLMTGAAGLACVALVARIAGRLGRPAAPAVLLVGTNPALLLWAVGGAHNDLLMLLLTLIGVDLALAGRERAGAATATAAVAIKAAAALPLAFLVIGARDRIGTLKAGAATLVAIIGVAVVAFGSHAVAFLDVLGTQQDLDSAASVPAQLGAWFGWVGSPPGVRAVAGVLLAGVALWQLARTWRGADWVESAAWTTLAVTALSSWMLAWYVVWLLPLAALSRSRWLWAGATAMTAFVILVRMVPLVSLS
jgi:alpha-1,6-mannosyltransferase